MTIDILTLFPIELEKSLHGLLKKAISKGIVKINFINIRDFSQDSYRSVDDHPYGGGLGMIMKCPPIEKAIDYSKKNFKADKQNLKELVILLDASGKKLEQADAARLCKFDHLILICGHYEGVDQRIKDYLIDETISVGDYILSGGEYPAMILTDSIARLLPTVLKNGVVENESFAHTDSKILEYPQYTRPENFKGHKVPKVLLSGNHKEIEKWRDKKSLQLTKKLRPDLLKT